jgi:hypothetical protein
MIEFKETHHKNYTELVLVADGMPEGIDPVRDYTYSIWHYHDTCEGVWPVVCRSRSCGAGSTRAYYFKTLDEAFAHAIKWAKAKQAEQRRHLKALNPQSNRLPADWVL